MDAQVTRLVVILLMLVDIVTSQTVTVDINADPDVNITQGQLVLLSCQVGGAFDDATDTLIIQKNAGVLTTLASEEGNDPSAPINVQFVGWVSDNGGHILRLIISNISRLDYGNYTCKALRPQGINTNDILLAQQTITVDVLFPPSGQPSCETSPLNPDLSYYDGDEITLQCTSDAGNPPVPLQWFRTGNITSIPNARVQRLYDSSVSVIYLTLTTDFDGVTFVCVRKNAGSSNPDTCLLGPFTVLNKTATHTWLAEGYLIPVIVVAGVIPVIAFIIIVIICLVRSEQCQLPVKTETTNSRTVAISLPMVKDGYEKISNEDSQNNLSKDHIGPSTKDVQVYEAVQSNKSQGKISSAKKKKYPKPPEYPRPPKNLQSADGKHYANAEIVCKKPLGGTDTDIPDGIQSCLKPPGETNSSASPNMPKTADTKGQFEMTVYANPSGAISNSAQLPAPSESPPPPPAEANSTQGLE